MNLNLTLVAQAITFSAFIWFTVKFVWPYMLRAIETRQKTIADGLAAAKAEIDQELNRAREELRDRVASLAVAGAEKILRREVDARSHSDLLESIKQQL